MSFFLHNIKDWSSLPKALLAIDCLQAALSALTTTSLTRLHHPLLLPL